jgi:hypothetical protein
MGIIGSLKVPAVFLPPWLHYPPMKTKCPYLNFGFKSSNKNIRTSKFVVRHRLDPSFQVIAPQPNPFTGEVDYEGPSESTYDTEEDLSAQDLVRFY